MFKNNTFNKIKNVLNCALNYVFPQTCMICAKLNKSGFCNDCKKLYSDCMRNKNEPIPHINHEMSCIKNAYAPFWYTQEIMHVVRKVKFHGELNLIDFCAKSMVECISQNIAYYDIIVCVPKSGIKSLARDNIPALLALKISKQLGIPFYKNALKKLRNTKKQSMLKPIDRLENVLGAYGVNAKYLHHFEKARVLLIDDVFTTGATANECAKAIAQNNATFCDVLCFAASYKF